MGNDTCSIRDYCTRHRKVLLDELDRHDPGAEYRLHDFKVDQNRLTAGLKRAQNSPKLLHNELSLTLSFYQDGIMRVMVAEPDSDRFRISQEGIAVEE